MKPKKRRVSLSQSQFNTLLYWAKIGISLRGEQYLEKYPRRKQPQQKLWSIQCSSFKKEKDWNYYD